MNGNLAGPNVNMTFGKTQPAPPPPKCQHDMNGNLAGPNRQVAHGMCVSMLTILIFES